MTEEQIDMFIEWSMNLIVKHQLDYFRGSVLRSLAYGFMIRNSWSLKASLLHCNSAEERSVSPRMNDYDELSKELDEIAKEVPLSDTTISAISCIFRGEWKDAISHIKEIEVDFNKRK